MIIAWGRAAFHSLQTETMSVGISSTWNQHLLKNKRSCSFQVDMNFLPHAVFVCRWKAVCARRQWLLRRGVLITRNVVKSTRTTRGVGCAAFHFLLTEIMCGYKLDLELAPSENHGEVALFKSRIRSTMWFSSAGKRKAVCHDWLIGVRWKRKL